MLDLSSARGQPTGGHMTLPEIGELYRFINLGNVSSLTVRLCKIAGYGSG